MSAHDQQLFAVGHGPELTEAGPRSGGQHFRVRTEAAPRDRSCVGDLRGLDLQGLKLPLHFLILGHFCGLGLSGLFLRPQYSFLGFWDGISGDPLSINLKNERILKFVIQDFFF
jgi:hypothetical protein